MHLEPHLALDKGGSHLVLGRINSFFHNFDEKCSITECTIQIWLRNDFHFPQDLKKNMDDHVFALMEIFKTPVVETYFETLQDTFCEEYIGKLHRYDSFSIVTMTTSKSKCQSKQTFKA